jgi:hypothetical protein
MRPLACLVAAGMLALSAPVAGADEVAYGQAYDTLYSIDIASHTATEVGSAGRYGGQLIASLSGLTATSDGTVYAYSGGLKALVRVDLSSGVSTVVGSIGLNGTGQFDALDVGLATDCDDTIWLASGTLQELYRINPSTGAATLVGSMGHPISGLVAKGNVLYGTGDAGDHKFYLISKATGAATAIGDFGADVPSALNSVSMSFDAAGTLWAVLNYVPPTTGNTIPDWSDLARVDPTTGAISIVGPITGPESLRTIGMKGFLITPRQCGGAIAATPAPALSLWSLLMLGIGVAAIAVLTLFPKRRTN